MGFTVSLQTVMESLADLYGSNYQIILNKNDSYSAKNQGWCHSDKFYIYGYSDRNVEDIIKNCEQHSKVLQKLDLFQSFTSQLIFNKIEYYGIFISIINSEGEKVGYLIKVEENYEISEIYDAFILNSLINILISLMLMIVIISYNNIHGRMKEMKMFDAMVVTANHEIKQPLSIITSYIEILQDKEDIDDKTKKKLEKIWVNADKINQILEKMKQIEDPSYVDYANFTKMIDIEDKNKSSIEN